MKTKLDVRVEGVNLANSIANELQPKLIEAMRPFLGEKVETLAGPLTKKVSKVIDAIELPNTVRCHVYRNHSNYSLFWTVKTCLDLNGHAYYHEVSMYVGNLRDGVLESLYEPNVLRTDYTAEGVYRAREAYKAAKKIADDAHSALHPFGEYDQ